jgi:mono/diheme cytochrome c family protein
MVTGRRILVGLWGAVLLSSATLPLRAATHGGTGVPTWAFLNEYCSKCHNAEDWAGGVAFDTMSEGEIPQNAAVMEKVIRKLRSQQMPPGGNKMPEKQLTTSFVSWMETSLDTAAKSHPDPGYVGLHRLNRKEYANAVRDLLNIEIDAAALLPRDEPRDGFDNNAQALQVTPSFLDQYIGAARSVVVQAMGNKDALPAGTTYRARNPSTQFFHEEGLPLGTRGGIAVDHNFPADGEYVLNIANMAQALWVYNMEFENTLVVTVDGEQVYETTIGGEEDMKAIDQKQDPAVDAINKRLKNIRFTSKAGVHKLVVAFRHRSFAESEDRLQMYVPGGGQDRVLRVSSFEVRGPYNATGVSRTASRDTIFSCYPKAAAEEQACARQIVSRIAHRAFRRPVVDEDLTPLMAFYATGRKSSDFDAGVRRAITAVLAHPDFLFRSDEPSAPLPPGSVYAIDDLALASRLSFFLWSSLPDDALLDAAQRGQLHDRAQLTQQVKRMLADPRAKSLATNFGAQWLNLSKLAEITPEPSVFPYGSGAGDLREDFKTELALFMDSVFRGDQSVLELLGSRYTFVNERLALHYGINSVRGDQFRKVELQDSARWGLLGKGGVLMTSSYPNRTSPVLRGAYVLERIMGTPPPIPPPAVEALKENEAGKKALTVRALLETHRAKPQCHSCHAAMDPLGFALEGFDATGKRRDIDRYARTAIDTSGELPNGTLVKGPTDLRKALLENPSGFVQNVTERLMIFGLGRTIEAHDMPIVRDIVRRSAEDNYRFSTLILNIVTSDAFQKARVPANDGALPIKQAAVQR